MVAFEFTPCHSAGVQRPSKFAQYLQKYKWRPIVLTAENTAHINIDPSTELPIPSKDIYQVDTPDAKKVFGLKNNGFCIPAKPYAIDRFKTKTVFELSTSIIGIP